MRTPRVPGPAAPHTALERPGWSGHRIGRLATLVLAGTTALVGGCTDDPLSAKPRASQPNGLPNTSVGVEDTSAAGRASGELARALAIALADSGVRMQLLAHLRDSPFPKHALHASRYLRGPRGAALLAKAARATDRSPADLLGADTRALEDFQLVAPYSATRALWTGDAAQIVVVGSGLSRADRIQAGQVTGYTVGAGAAVTVRTTESANTFVLAVYPSEQPAVFGNDPEQVASRAPAQHRATITSPNLELAALDDPGRASPAVTARENAAEPSPTPAKAATPGGITAPNMMPICEVTDPECVPPDPCINDPYSPECGGTPPPPPAPPGYAPSEVGGFDWYGCTYAYGANDQDQDGLQDACEYQLARAFRPYLAVHPWDKDLRREPYWAAALDFPWYNSGSPVLKIMYLEAYYSDRGEPITRYDSGHPGDSEWVTVFVRYENGRWALLQTSTSAHWNTDAESSRNNAYSEHAYPDGRLRGRPLIWVSRDKHANYASQWLCERGGWDAYGAIRGLDTCAGNEYYVDPWIGAFYEIEVRPDANVGNRYAPAGPLNLSTGYYVRRGVPLITSAPSRGGLPGFWGGMPGYYPEFFWEDQPMYNFCGWNAIDRYSFGGAQAQLDCASPYHNALKFFYS